MKLELTRTGAMAFEAISEDGVRVSLDGPEKYGGVGSGLRPMEMFLVSLAGCASIDVVLILEKQKHALTALRVAIEGKRTDSIPAVYESIHLRYEVGGDIPDNKLQRAVRMSVEKYCSVASMLLPSVVVTWEAHAASDVV